MKPLLVCLAAAFAVHANAADDLPALIRGNTAFAIEMYRLQTAGNDANVFFSPYSISTAMAMVAAGARGDTEAEIAKALRFPFGGTRLTHAWMAVRDDVNRKRQSTTLLTANALWAAKDVEFVPEYRTLAKKDFAAKLETVDFAQAEAARQQINAWVSENTRQKIPQLIGAGVLSPATRLVLTNAIYMKAEWLNKFRPRETNNNGIFHAPSGNRKAAMMQMEEDLRFAKGGGVRLLELPYASEDLSMLIVLPDAANGLANVEKSLTPDKLAEWDKRLATTLVDVILPRFKTDTSLMLGRALQSMGIHQAFTTSADFSGIARERILISDVIHQARIDVAEEGTEAAAATAVIGVTAVAPPPNPPKPEIFNADHPFLYLIRSRKTGAVLFIGRLMQP